MLLLFCISAASLLFLVKKAITSNKDYHEISSIADFFRQTAEQAANERASKLPTAIRHLSCIAKIHSNDDKVKLDTVMLALEIYPEDDRVVLLSLTLISVLISGSTDLQNQLWYQSNELQFIISILQSSISRAKAIDDPPEKGERLSADIQRRGCLLLGGLAENNEAASKVIEKGGLDAIIDTLQWYRFHAGVCKWGLWAVFHLCYDRREQQTSLLDKGGIQVVCSCIKNNSCVDVTRHGIAILFDIMRSDGETATKAKLAAFQEGLDDILVESMDEYPDDQEIGMMCQQILGGTKTFEFTGGDVSMNWRHERWGQLCCLLPWFEKRQH